MLLIIRSGLVKNADCLLPENMHLQEKGTLMPVICLLPLRHPAALLHKPSFEPDTIVKYKKLKTINLNNEIRTHRIISF